MPAAVFAAVPSFQKVFFGKHNVAFFAHVEVFWIKLLSSRKYLFIFHHASKIAMKDGNGERQTASLHMLKQ